MTRRIVFVSRKDRFCDYFLDIQYIIINAYMLRMVVIDKKKIRFHLLAG